VVDVTLWKKYRLLRSNALLEQLITDLYFHRSKPPLTNEELIEQFVDRPSQIKERQLEVELKVEKEAEEKRKVEAEKELEAKKEVERKDEQKRSEEKRREEQLYATTDQPTQQVATLCNVSQPFATSAKIGEDNFAPDFKEFRLKTISSIISSFSKDQNLYSLAINLSNTMLFNSFEEQYKTLWLLNHTRSRGFVHELFTKRKEVNLNEWRSLYFNFHMRDN